jgi:hypothetical protein
MVFRRGQRILETNDMQEFGREHLVRGQTCILTDTAIQSFSELMEFPKLEQLKETQLFGTDSLEHGQTWVKDRHLMFLEAGKWEISGSRIKGNMHASGTALLNQELI